MVLLRAEEDLVLICQLAYREEEKEEEEEEEREKGGEEYS